ncbi:serine protease [Mesorhizobium sp. M0050]|uniref:trypsin-like serine peptidase n=1 Tax=Mesorhizobium sp. M0050 TaxID=2956861 RepID=UPI003335FCBA
MVLGRPSFGWEANRVDPVGQDLNIEVQLGSIPGKRVWRSGVLKAGNFGDLAQVSLNVEGEFSAFGDAILSVFNSDGNVVESIALSTVKQRSIWTNFAKGPGVVIEVHSATALPDAPLTIKRAVREGYVGHSDVSPDGSPLFELPGSISGLDQNALDATARLIVGQNDLPIGTSYPSSTPDWCSGFMVGKNLLMTASHCVKGKDFCTQTVALFGYSVEHSQPLAARSCVKLVYMNPYIDTAIIQIADGGANDAYVRLSGLAPTEGEKLFVVEHPNGAIRLVSRDEACKVSSAATGAQPSRSDLDENLLDNLAFAHGCDTLEGSSGAPVFSARNEVIGLHQAGFGNFNYAIRSDVILSCVAIDASAGEVTVIQPGEAVCKNKTN